MTPRFPLHGADRAEILADLTETRRDDLPYDGRAFAFIYDAGRENRALAREAFGACMNINGLDPTVFPSARKLENFVVGAMLELLGAPDGAVGTATAGGTESVLLAVKTARDHARRHRPHITTPKMLLPETAHACFHKASWYFGVEVIPVAVDPETFRADVDDARTKMTEDVVLVVGSAPSYAHGVIDPISELAALAQEHGCLMHVDACVGGCVLPFMRDNGVPLPAFDFTVPGVTSISADLHKYGFAPKGISVILQRTRELREAQYYACATWSGYGIVNATTLGSKSVAALGAAYALMRRLGRQGYRENAQKMWSATRELTHAIDALEGVRLLTPPDMNLFAFTTTDGDVFTLSDRLNARGWHVQPTYAFGVSPAHIHLTLDPSNAGGVGGLAADLAECLIDLPPAQEPAAEVVAMLALLGEEGDLNPGMLMAGLGISDGQLPAESAPIHRLINAASPPAREQLLKLFIGELFS